MGIVTKRNIFIRFLGFYLSTIAFANMRKICDKSKTENVVQQGYRRFSLTRFHRA
jgi:hypothetical protein